MPDCAAKRHQLYDLLGDLPAIDRPISARTVDISMRDGYVLETLLLDLNGYELVPAYLARPLEISGPVPAILYNHAHGGDWKLGKTEFIEGREALGTPPYAKQLTGMGYCALCIDSWNFGERRGRTESELFKELLWKGQVLWGLMVYDSLRALDYLSSRSDVDASRLGTLGMSMGSTMAWWVAALDERVEVCVDICCLTDYHELIRTRGLDGHGLYYYVPGLLQHFDTSTINALIAPRAHLALAGDYDALTPPLGLDMIDGNLKMLYASYGVPEKWRLLRFPVGHVETAAGRAAVVAFLQRWL